MTVAELIEKLSGYDPQLPVMFPDWEEGPCEIERVDLETVGLDLQCVVLLGY